MRGIMVRPLLYLRASVMREIESVSSLTVLRFCVVVIQSHSVSVSGKLTTFTGEGRPQPTLSQHVTRGVRLDSRESLAQRQYEMRSIHLHCADLLLRKEAGSPQRDANKCIGDDTKGVARRSSNCIRKTSK